MHDLLRRNARSNRNLAAEARSRGDERAHWFYLGQALVYRRCAQRLKSLES